MQKVVIRSILNNVKFILKIHQRPRIYMSVIYRVFQRNLPILKFQKHGGIRKTNKLQAFFHQLCPPLP